MTEKLMRDCGVCSPKEKLISVRLEDMPGQFQPGMLSPECGRSQLPDHRCDRTQLTKQDRNVTSLCLTSDAQ